MGRGKNLPGYLSAVVQFDTCNLLDREVEAFNHHDARTAAVVKVLYALKPIFFKLLDNDFWELILLSR